ncbi:MAG: hypothetical protein JWR39_2724 [Devosia sp.]|nr:hypothetical protein [Devosia sp.]
MTTAKPQPMAAQSTSPDDLIAELARLMAEDATPAQPSPPPAPPGVRVPGAGAAAADQATPAPASSRYDFGRFTPAPAPQPIPAAPPAPAEPAHSRAAPPFAVEPASAAPKSPEDPFDFDFGFGAPDAASAQPEPARSSPPAPAQPVSAPEHDSIGDLIAAELFGAPELHEPAPAPGPLQSQAPEPGASQPESPRIAMPVAEPRMVPELRREPAPFQSAARIEPSMPAAVPRPSNPPAAPNAEWSAPPIAMHRDPAPAREPELPTLAATAPRPDAPQASSNDPIRDIEDLIGRAARVDLDPAPARPAPSPALRSLATPTLPPKRSAGEQRAVSGADEAILAAAAATGAEVGWVEDPEPVEPAPRGRRAKPERAPKPERVRRARPDRAERPPRAFGWSRALVGPAVALVVLLVAGSGLYWVLGMGGDSGPAPLLTADATPVKEAPPPAEETGSVGQSVVFNEIDGVVPGAEEQLVSRDQADVNEVTQVPPPVQPAAEGVVNRKVRTVTVRPDGTIVSGDDSVAGNAMLPVDRPNVPAVPGVDPAAPSLMGTLGNETPAGTPAPAAVPEPQATAAPPVTPVEPGSTVPAVDVSGAPIPGKTAPVPLNRPAGLAGPGGATTALPPSPAAATSLPPPPATTSPVNALVEPTPTAAPLAAAPSPNAPALTAIEATAAMPLSNAPAYVQLSSQRTEDAARQSALDIAGRYGPLFKGANLEVQRVDLGDKGIFYRVRVPANSTADANQLCSSLKSAGGDCFTL